MHTEIYTPQQCGWFVGYLTTLYQLHSLSSSQRLGGIIVQRIGRMTEKVAVAYVK
jgi:hypothetical protein